MSLNDIHNSVDNFDDCLPNILLADSDPELSHTLLKHLASQGIRGIVASDTRSALRQIKMRDFCLIIISESIGTEPGKNHPGGGMEFYSSLRAEGCTCPCVMVAENKTSCMEKAKAAIKAGLEDFLIKPVAVEKLRKLIDSAVKNTLAARHNKQSAIIGSSSKFKKILKMARTVAPTSVPVMIIGESGTGKELIADLIHRESRLSNKPFVKVNCAALNESLLESELFGHEKGAFTGADSARKGRFELADGGTLLLDEITETPLTFQAKLLRVLEQQQFERVGGQQTITVNVRVISTTNKNIIQEVQKGDFRRDLYYRLGAVRLMVPPLRERLDDIDKLIWHFTQLYSHEKNRNISHLDESMVEIFKNYSWPGNIRQLRNVVLTSIVLGSGPKLSLADVSWLFDELETLPQQDLTKQSDNADNINSLSGLGGYSLEQIERQAIIDTLQQTEGNQRKAAEVLGISDRTLRGKIKKYREDGCLMV